MQNPAPTRAELQHSLARLHAELAGAPRFDAGTQRLLRELLQDIERVLSVPSPASSDSATARSGAPAASAAESAARRLEELAVQFETRHPVLAASIRQFVDLLGRAGL